MIYKKHEKIEEPAHPASPFAFFHNAFFYVLQERKSFLCSFLEEAKKRQREKRQTHAPERSTRKKHEKEEREDVAKKEEQKKDNPAHILRLLYITR